MPTPLSPIISSEIAATGPMPFRRFMELALYHAEHGYYTCARASIGRRGDFFTNVSVGPLFGQLLARQFAEIWENLGSPVDFSIVEQGAHNGDFAHDALEFLGTHFPDCLAATTYRIVEFSPALAALQRARLAAHRVEWTSSLADLAPFAGVHFSNELPDAFPVHLVKWDGANWHEQHVTEHAGAFTFSDGPLTSAALAEACARIPQPLPPGYTTEVNLAAPAWLSEVAARLERGYVICIDYGHLREQYYARERTSGTLSAYAQHRRLANPLQDPGAIDLTAHVDFTALLQAGQEAGLKVAGYTDQHHFMVGLGAIHFVPGDTTAPPPPAAELRAFQTLMHPELMGAAFKVAVFTKAASGSLFAGLRYARPIPD